mgnify:CR=1 FL=1
MRESENNVLNIVSIIIGLIALIAAIIGFVPLLGWINWLVIPLVAVGLVIGLISRETTGRNVNLVVGLMAIVRLSIGGGII